MRAPTEAWCVTAGLRLARHVRAPTGCRGRYRRTQAGSPRASPYNGSPTGAGYVAAGCRGVPWRARSTPRGIFRFPSIGFEMCDSTSQSASLTAPLSGEPLAACVICGIQIPWNRCGRCCRPGCRVPGGACPVPCSARCAGNGAGTGHRRSWSWRRGFRCGRR